MRKVLLISFALLQAAVLASGQDTLEINGRSAQYLSRVPLIGSETAEAYSASAFQYAPLPALSAVEARFHYREEDRAFLQQEGDGLAEGEFHARSLVRMDGLSAVQGGVSYQRGVKKNVLWNTSSDFALLYPHVMADSVGGDLQKEQYSFYGKYARQVRRFVFGIEGQYRALHEYRQIDPRPRNITSDFTAKVSAGAHFGKHIASFSLAYRKYHQSQNVTFVDPRGANTSEFYFTGLGSHFARFSGSGAFVNARYRGEGFEASALLQPSGYKGLYGGVQYSRFAATRHLVNQNEAPITELLVQKLSAFAAGRTRCGDWDFGGELRGSFELRQGTENVIDNVQTGTFKSLLSLTMYRNRLYRAAFEGAAAWKRPYGTWSLSPAGGFYASEAEYLFPSRKMNLYKVCAGLHVGYLWSSGVWMAALTAGADCTRNIEGEFVLPMENTLPGIAGFYSDQYAKFTDNWTAAAWSARVQRALNAKTAVYLRADCSRIFFDSGDRSLCLKAAIGFTF